MSNDVGTVKRRGFMRGLYDWVMANAQGRYAWAALFGVSFAESSFFPIAPDVMLIPMVLADRKRAFLLAAWCTLASVLGGMLGYVIGALSVRLRRSMADLALRLWRARRRVPRLLRRMGRVGHPDQGREPHPLQARDHRVGFCGLQLSDVRAACRRSRAARGSRCGRRCSISTASRSATSSRSGSN